MDLLFELDWCEVAQRTVEPLVVVEDFDERDDRPADLDDRAPGLAVYQFLLESGEPALANGVVPALAFRRQALHTVMGFRKARNSVEVYCDPRSREPDTAAVAPGSGLEAAERVAVGNLIANDASCSAVADDLHSW